WRPSCCVELKVPLGEQNNRAYPQSLSRAVLSQECTLDRHESPDSPDRPGAASLLLQLEPGVGASVADELTTLHGRRLRWAEIGRSHPTPGKASRCRSRSFRSRIGQSL